MRRVDFSEFGGPEALQVEEVDVPTPGPGEVLIRAEAIGLNFVDSKVLRGPENGPFFQRPAAGNLMGDVVGTVTAVGADVDEGLMGTRVAALVMKDAVSDYSVAEAQWLVSVPEGLDLASASMLPVAGPVAFRVLRTGQLAPGESVLIHAAAGGVGHLAVQLAKLLGAGTVIGTASSESKLAFIKDLGADVAVNYTEESWSDRVREAAPMGVNVVLDSIGGEMLQSSIDLLAPFGRLVAFGAASGDPGSVPALKLFGLKSVTGFAGIVWRMLSPDLARQDAEEIRSYFAAGKLRASVQAELPLSDAAEAYRQLEDRSRIGRVLLLTGAG